MQAQQRFDSATIEALSKVLAETGMGITGSEISHLLADCNIRDVDHLNTKWRRLYNALASEQNRTANGAHIIGFIHKAMKPTRYIGDIALFQSRQHDLNRVLAFSGLTVSDDGKIRRTKPANTLLESEERANELQTKLAMREAHPDVLMFCKAELLQENYFHAVLEATKSVANKLRRLTGLQSDGADLATEALSFGKTGTPRLSINSLSNDTEKGEQRGFVNLLIGVFGTFRNPPAHAEKIYWAVNQQDALDILSILSLIHRKLDASKAL